MPAPAKGTGLLGHRRAGKGRGAQGDTEGRGAGRGEAAEPACARRHGAGAAEGQLGGHLR